MSNIDPATDNNDPFRALVARAAKGQATDAEREMLVSEGVRERYRATLLSLKRDAEAQLTERAAALATYKSRCIADGSKSAYFAEENAYQTWRAGALRYRNGIEERLSELRTQFGRVPPPKAQSQATDARRQRGEDIDARLDRIETMLARVLRSVEHAP